eukprot:11400853-Prorocentrum_lima.AAC.1
MDGKRHEAAKATLNVELDGILQEKLDGFIGTLSALMDQSLARGVDLVATFLVKRFEDAMATL